MVREQRRGCRRVSAARRPGDRISRMTYVSAPSGLVLVDQRLRKTASGRICQAGL